MSITLTSVIWNITKYATTVFHDAANAVNAANVLPAILFVLLK